MCSETTVNFENSKSFLVLWSVNVKTMETMESCCLFNKYMMEKCYVFGNENELN